MCVSVCLQAVLEVLQADLAVAGLEKDAADLLMRREPGSCPPMLFAWAWRLVSNFSSQHAAVVRPTGSRSCLRARVPHRTRPVPRRSLIAAQGI